LPIDRWAGVAGSQMHTRLSGGFFGVSDISQEANRELQSLALSVGNTLWQAGTDLVALSGQFCFAGQVGVAIDQGAAAIGHAVSSSGILVAVVVAVIILVLWRRSRHGTSPWGALVRAGVMVGVLAAMMAGASATHLVGGAADFGTFSPGWLVNEVYSTVDTLASAPTEAIAAQPTGLVGLATQGPASCGAYASTLVDAYKASYGGTVSQVGASLPIALNDMWEQAGLRTYIEVQFGAANPYGDWAWCHQLDFNSGYTPAEQVAVARQALPTGTAIFPQALAWPAPGANNADVDAGIIGWAACEGWPGHWAIPASWAAAGVTQDDCETWWSQSGVPSSLNWGPSTSAVTQAAATASSQGADGAALADFLLNYHGDANGTADAAAITYAVSSLVVFVIFAVLAGAVLVAKTALLVVMLLLAAVVVLSLWPGQSQGRLGQVARYTFGLVVFATGAQAIVALVALVTGVVSEMVGSLAGGGSFLDVLAMGFAPVGAVYILHFVFTKVLRAPSPFKISGALAWASAAGAVGAGVASVVDRHVDQRGRALARQAGRAVLSRYGAARPDRMSTIGAMRPADQLGQLGAPKATGAGALVTAAMAGGPAGAIAALASGGAGLQRGGRDGRVPAQGGAGWPVSGPGQGTQGGSWQADGNQVEGGAAGDGQAEGSGKNPHAAALGRLGAQARWGARQPGPQATGRSETGGPLGGTQSAGGTWSSWSGGRQAGPGQPAAGAAGGRPSGGPRPGPGQWRGPQDEARPQGEPSGSRGPGQPAAGAAGGRPSGGPRPGPGQWRGPQDEARPQGEPSGSRGPGQPAAGAAGGRPTGGRPSGGPRPGPGQWRGPQDEARPQGGPSGSRGPGQPAAGAAGGRPTGGRPSGGPRPGPGQWRGPRWSRATGGGAQGAGQVQGRRSGAMGAAGERDYEGASEPTNPQVEPAQVMRWASWRRVAAERHAQRREQREAESQGLALLRAAEGGHLDRARSAITDWGRHTYERFRVAPIRGLARGAVLGGAAVAGLVVTTASAPIAAIGGALWAGHRVLRWRAEAPARRAEGAAHREVARNLWQMVQAGSTSQEGG